MPKKKVSNAVCFYSKKLTPPVSMKLRSALAVGVSNVEIVIGSIDI
jgi:hypothetical protein